MKTTKKTKVVKNDVVKTVSVYNKSTNKDIVKISNDLNTEDMSSITNYGIDIQQKLNSYSSDMLRHIKNVDTGEIGVVISDLLKDLSIIEIDFDEPSFFKFFKKIPLVKTFIRVTKNALVKYEEINNNLDSVILKLDKGRVSLLKDINSLESMYNKNIEYIKDLELYISAGELKIQELNEKIKTFVINTDYDEFELKNLKNYLDRLEKKILDLKLTRVITIQSLPQIKIIQGNNNLMVDKIQTSILNTIPLWRNHISLSVSLDKQKRLIELQKGINETTKTILLKNSENLKDNSINIAKLNEEVIVSIDTIKKINDDLISTLDEIIKIKEQGDIDRKQITQELFLLEDDIKNKIVDIKRLSNE
jgi:uncharacterized protein YaaN involved in tellurite resistance